MSPVSRPRGKPKRKQKNRNATRRSDLILVPEVRQDCDCPACSGEGVDPAQLLGEMLGEIADLAEREDALDVELAGAALVTILLVAGDEFLPAFVEVVIPQIEADPGDGGLALLIALGSIAAGLQEQVAEAAFAAANRLGAAGMPAPRWAGELAEPVRVGACMRLYDTQETMSVLVASFRRASREHALIVVVDEQDCGAAAEILLVHGDDLHEALDDIRAGGRADGLDLGTQTLDPAELRWYVEEALEARAVHDADTLAEPATMFDDEGEPPYALLATLLRSRLAALPEARKPAGAREHVHPGPDAATTLLEDLAKIISAAGGPGGRLGGLGFARPAPAKLPTKRKKSDGPAPIYQIKVGLLSARPPIWRRLLVPADVSLARLHDIIQAAFGWDDGHMHVFETPYGAFGRADRELGHRAEAPVTLEQVAPTGKDKIRYTYDFGDDWVHEVLVEKVLDRDPARAYPCCTGGRRAAPPDDCGGIWGYEELVAVLADPRHPDHEDRLEWLGLDDPKRFDPAAFDVDEVNRALAKLP